MDNDSDRITLHDLKQTGIILGLILALLTAFVVIGPWVVILLTWYFGWVIGIAAQ